MGLFGLFSGKSPETHEQRGDRFAEAGAYGDARIEYETALHKIDRKFPEKSPLAERIRQKMHHASEGLSRSHLENAEILLNAGDVQEAAELFQLALELTGDEKLRHTLTERIQNLTAEPLPKKAYFQAPIDLPDDEAQEPLIEEDDDDEELFSVLCHALPEEVEDAYRSFGEAFRLGYVALNRGDFETAAELLGRAMEENPSAGIISLELATAHIHLKDYDYARQLLEAFLESHPEEIRAYQLICEICWDAREFDRAEKLLAGCPPNLRDNPAILLLRGETRYQQEAFEDAEAAFNRYIEINGQDEIVGRALAKAKEGRGDLAGARELYAQIINQCTACRTRVDPFLKRRYAELSFETGDKSNKLVELYLALTQEDPANRSFYYQRIATLYEKRGDIGEARRFASFGAENR